MQQLATNCTINSYHEEKELFMTVVEGNYQKAKRLIESGCPTDILFDTKRVFNKMCMISIPLRLMYRGDNISVSCLSAVDYIHTKIDILRDNLISNGASEDFIITVLSFHKNFLKYLKRLEK